MAAVGTTSGTIGRESSRTDAVEEEIDTAETGEMGTARTGVKAETMDSGEGTGGVAEIIGTHPNSPTSKIYSGNSANNMSTAREVGRFAE